MAKGQLAIEALACIAALLAFILLLCVAVKSAEARANDYSSWIGDESRAGLLALEIDLLSADGRLSAFGEAELGDCALTGNGVLCGNASAETIAGNSGDGRYGYYGSLPG